MARFDLEIFEKNKPTLPQSKPVFQNQNKHKQIFLRETLASLHHFMDKSRGHINLDK